MIAPVLGAGGSFATALVAVAELARAGADANEVEAAAADLATARQRFHDSLTEPSLLSAVAWQVGLDPGEAEVLALLLACETDPQLHRSAAPVEPGRPWALRLDAVARLFPAPHVGVLAVAPDARLSRAELVRIEGDGPWFSRTVRLPDSVVWSFVGDRSLDVDLPPRIRVVPGGGPREGAPPLVLATGADRESRLTRLAADLPARGCLVAALPTEPVQWRALIREATLQSLAVVLETGEALSPAATAWVDRSTHLAWGISTPHELPMESLPQRRWRELVVESGRADAEEWRAAVDELPVNGYELDREQLRLVGTAVRGGADIVTAVRRLSGGHLDRLTTRIRPRRTWADLVLSPQQTAQVQMIAQRYRLRGTVYREWGFSPAPSTGVVAMFSGPSGTGKTLTAEIIAKDLGLDLFRIDLSTVVSKYIGETEQNLEAVFRAAEAGEGVLLFDEADAVFGKRSEVTDARDRYANIESAYLLQRLERTDALVILTTNLPGNIDDAFLRRIHVNVPFEIPAVDQRHELWKMAFPPDCPRDDLDLQRLAADFELAGGPITNVAVSAAFRAAAEGVPVSSEHVGHSLRTELVKMRRMGSETALRSWAPLTP